VAVHCPGMKPVFRLAAGIAAAFASVAPAWAQRTDPYAGVYVSTRVLLADRNDPPLDYARVPASGVYVHLVWNQVEPSPGRYDWSKLDREVEAAVAAGKKLSISINSGAYAPGWLPKVAATSRFTVGKGGVNRSCITAVVGHPWDPRYQQRYVGVMRALADHLRQRPQVWRQVAIIKMTGVSQTSEELRLPSNTGVAMRQGRPDPCQASDAVATWRGVGYAPDRVVQGYLTMLDGVAAAFPGKVIAQDTLDRNDFPRIDGRSDGDVKARIVRAAIQRLPGRYAVQWDGLNLGPLPPSVLAAKAMGAPIGWQTNAFLGVRGAGCNATRQEGPQPCDARGYAALLGRGIDAGGRYLEVWRPNLEAFPDVVRAADQRLRAGG
jgi:hypothetical protein